MSIMDYIMLFFGLFISLYMLIVVLTYSSMLFISFTQLRKVYRLDKSELDEDAIDFVYSKPISIIVPAYNEEAGIVESIHSLLNIRYPQVEYIIVNDGSTDRTQEILIEQFKMKPIEKIIRTEIPSKPVEQIFQSTIHPNLLLAVKENGGKADSLNAGINIAKYPYFCSIDGDSILQENALLRIMKPIITSNEKVIAAGGNIRVANGTDIHLGAVSHTNLSNQPLVIMQVIEYLRAFLMGRIALSKFNLVLIISGAFSVFNKKWVVKAGGYSVDMIGEDMELVVKLHRILKEEKSDNRIEFVSDPVCWTEVPEKFSFLRKQRRRWHQGLLASLWKHKRMTLNPKYGAIGMVSFPFFWIIEALGPIIELGGYLYIILSFLFGNIYYEYAILLTLLFILYGTVLSITSILLEAWAIDTYPKSRDVLRMIYLSITEIFWYKPLTLIWRIEGIIRFIFNRKDWGEMKRVGLAKKEVSR